MSADNPVLRAPPPFPGLPPRHSSVTLQQQQSRGVYLPTVSNTTPLTSTSRRTLQPYPPASSSLSPPESPQTPTSHNIINQHQKFRLWSWVAILVLLVSWCSLAIFPKLFSAVDKDSLMELELNVVTQKSESSSQQTLQKATHTRHHLPLKSLALQHRQLLDFELYTPPHEMLHRKATAGTTTNVKSKAPQTRAGKGKQAGQFPWRKVFIVANLYNNEDLVDDFTASLGSFIRRGILGMGLEGGATSTGFSQHQHNTADLYLKPEDVFVSVYSNANTDSTPYMLRDVLASELVSISTDYNQRNRQRLSGEKSEGKLGFHVVPQGVPFCARQRHGVRASGYSFTEEDTIAEGEKYSSEAFDPGNERAGKPKDLSRIQWLACLRNTAMLPLYIRGVDGLFPSPQTNNGNASSSSSSSSSSSMRGNNVDWINHMNAEYIEWKYKLMMTSTEESSTITGKRSRVVVDDGYDAFLEHLYISSTSASETEKEIGVGNGDSPRMKKKQDQYQHKSDFIKNFIQGDKKGRWWEMMSSHTHYAHHPFNSAEPSTSSYQSAATMNSTERRTPGAGDTENVVSVNDDDDDVLVLFFNDIYFYPWQVSHLITPATTTAILSSRSTPSSSQVKEGVDEEGDGEAAAAFTTSDNNAVSLEYGDRFDMTCAMDFYYNLYDTWVVRGVDGQPYSPYPPFARDQHSKGLLRSVMGTNGVYNQVKNAAYFFEPDAEEVEGVSSSEGQIQRRDDQSSSFPGRYVARGQRVLESLLTTPSRQYDGQSTTSSSTPSTTLTGLNLPIVPVRSCWNGVVAIRASMFTRHGLKFRYPTEEEKERCPDSECKYIGEDIIDIQSRNQLRRISKMMSSADLLDSTLPSSTVSSSNLKSSRDIALLRPASIAINTLVQVSYESGFFEMFQGEQVQNDVKIRVLGDHPMKGSADDPGGEYVQWVSMSWYVPPQDPITMSDARMANSLLYRVSDSRSGGSRHWISGSQIGAGRGGGLLWDWLLSSIHYHLPHSDGGGEEEGSGGSRRCLRSSSVQFHSISFLCISARASPPTLLAATWNTIHFLMSTPIRIVCFVLDWSIVPVLRVLRRILTLFGLRGQWVPTIPVSASGEWTTRPLSEMSQAALSSLNIIARLRHFYSSGFFFDFVSWLSVGEGAGGGVFNADKDSTKSIQLPPYPLHPTTTITASGVTIGDDVRCANERKSFLPPLVVGLSASKTASPVLVFNSACQLEPYTSPSSFQDSGMLLDSVISLATSFALLRDSQAVSLPSTHRATQNLLREWRREVIRTLRVNTAGSARCGDTTIASGAVDDMLWKFVVDRLIPEGEEAMGDDYTTTTLLKTLLLRASYRYLGVSFNFGIWGRDEETERVAARHRSMIHQMMASRPQPSRPEEDGGTSSTTRSSHLDLRFAIPLEVFRTSRSNRDWCSVLPCEFVRYQAVSITTTTGDAGRGAVCRGSNNDGVATTFEEASTQLAVSGVRPRDLSPVVFALSSPSAMTCLWVTSTFNVKTSVASMSIWGLLVLFLAPLACATCLSITIRKMACTKYVCGDCGGGDGCVGATTILTSDPLSGVCGCAPPEGLRRMWSTFTMRGLFRKVYPIWVARRGAASSPVSSSVTPYRSSSDDHVPYAIVIPNANPFDDGMADDSSTTIRPVVVRNVHRP